MKNDFIVTNIEYRYVSSNEISLYESKPIKDGVKSAYVECKSCGHGFHESNFYNSFGYIKILCKECKKTELINLKDLRHVTAQDTR